MRQARLWLGGASGYNGGSRQRDPLLNVFPAPRVTFPAIVAAAVAAILILAAGIPAGGQGPASPALTILSKDGRRALPLNIVNDQELVFLDDLASAFQLTVREESLGTLTVAYKGRTILLTPDQPLVSIAGRLVSLPASPTRSGRRVMVPVNSSTGRSRSSTMRASISASRRGC